MPLLNGIIFRQRYERALTSIAQILVQEFANQFLISKGATPKVKAVYIERMVPPADTECPCINVTLSRGDYSNKDERMNEGVYTYEIEVYTTGKTTGSQRGDYASRIELQRILGMIRTILDSPQYATLNFEPPYIATTATTRIEIMRQTEADNAYMSVGVLSFMVRMPEEVVLSEDEYIITDAVTKVQIGDSESGHLWVYFRLHEGVYDIGYE